MPQRIIGGSRDVNGKILMIGLSPQEGDDNLYLLTQRQIMSLATVSEPLKWMKRHISLPSDIPSQIELNDWHNDLIERLYTPMDFCQLMIDNAECFLSDEDVIDKLLGEGSPFSEKIIERLKEIDRRLPSGQSGYNLLSKTGCNFDKIFNVCYKLVEYLDTITGQLFAAIEQISNINERAALFSSAIQSEVNMPMDELLTFIDDLLENVKEEYSTRFVVGGTLHYKIACEIFCQYRDDCAMNMDNVSAYYISKTDIEFGTVNSPMRFLNAIANFILTGDIPLDVIVYAMHTLVLGVINSGEQFLGNTFFSIKTIIDAASDEENNDWNDYCEDCAEDVPDPYCLDLTEQWYTFRPNANDTFYGTYIEGEGLAGTPYYGNTDNCIFIWVMGPTGGASDPIEKFVIKFNEPRTDFYIYNSGGLFNYTGSPTLEIEVNKTDNPTMFPFDHASNTMYMQPNAASGKVTNTFRLIEACLYPNE